MQKNKTIKIFSYIMFTLLFTTTSAYALVSCKSKSTTPPPPPANSLKPSDIDNDLNSFLNMKSSERPDLTFKQIWEYEFVFGAQDNAGHLLQSVTNLSLSKADSDGRIVISVTGHDVEIAQPWLVTYKVTTAPILIEGFHSMNYETNKWYPRFNTTYYNFKSERFYEGHAGMGLTMNNILGLIKA